MSAPARPPAPIAATHTVSLGGVAPLPAMRLRGSTLKRAMPPVALRKSRLFMQIILISFRERGKGYHILSLESIREMPREMP